VSLFVDEMVPIAPAPLRFVSILVLLWLALSFGRTLRRGAMPMIEPIARRDKPELSAALCRYTRVLTTAWCLYFVAAAAAASLASFGAQPAGLAVATASTMFFVGEYWLRLRLFPDETFPGLLREVADTVRVCGAPAGAKSP
jgi:uncharacterized membrane protein